MPNYVTNIQIAINSIILFSISVALVIGSFKDVPRHAHWIEFLFSNTFVTPIVVMPRITSVVISANWRFNRNKNRNPKTVSIKG